MLCYLNIWFCDLAYVLHYAVCLVHPWPNHYLLANAGAALCVLAGQAERLAAICRYISTRATCSNTHLMFYFDPNMIGRDSPKMWTWCSEAQRRTAEFAWMFYYLHAWNSTLNMLSTCSLLWHDLKIHKPIKINMSHIVHYRKFIAPHWPFSRYWIQPTTYMGHSCSTHILANHGPAYKIQYTAWWSAVFCTQLDNPISWYWHHCLASVLHCLPIWLYSNVRRQSGHTMVVVCGPCDGKTRIYIKPWTKHSADNVVLSFY